MDPFLEALGIPRAPMNPWEVQLLPRAIFTNYLLNSSDQTALLLLGSWRLNVEPRGIPRVPIVPLLDSLGIPTVPIVPFLESLRIPFERLGCLLPYSSSHARPMVRC